MPSLSGPSSWVLSLSPGSLVSLGGGSVFSDGMITGLALSVLLYLYAISPMGGRRG